VFLMSEVPLYEPLGYQMPTHVPVRGQRVRIDPTQVVGREREVFFDNLLVRVHWIIEMIVIERPCAMGV